MFVLTVTFGVFLFLLPGVLQLPLVVGSRHVHADTQRLHERIFYFIQLGPDAGLQDGKT